MKAPNFEVHEPTLCAYDKATGKVVGEVALPRNATGAPMTYMRERQAIHRRPDRGLQSSRGTHRVLLCPDTGGPAPVGRLPASSFCVGRDDQFSPGRSLT